MAKALIIIDMQNDFVTGPLGTDEARSMLTRLVKKLDAIVEEGAVDLIFTQDTHADNYLDTQEGRNLPVPHCIKKTDGWQIVPELQRFTPRAKAVIEKKAFGSTRLPSLIKPYEVVEFAGVCTDICVVSNALLIKAFYPEQRVQIDAACCAGSTPEAHRNALNVMANCQCKIINAD